MSDFLAAEDRALLERNGLATFDALWAKQLDAVIVTGSLSIREVYRNE